MEKLKAAVFLRKARQSAGLTQLEVGKLMGYSNSQFVSNWERQMSMPPISSLRKLAKLYSVDLDELFKHVYAANLEAAAESMKKEYAKTKKRGNC